MSRLLKRLSARERGGKLRQGGRGRGERRAEEKKVDRTPNMEGKMKKGGERS